jgi:GNAT superfamily N-acetyltransferase
MEIVKPNADEVKECFDIEKFYELNVSSSESVGFFLPGTAFETYLNLFKDGYLRIIKDKSRVIAFVMVVPPGHKIIKTLFSSDSMILFSQGSVELEKVYWIAKVAVLPEYARKGYAKKLYQRIQKDFSGCTSYTATAVSPKRNFASEAFHEELELRKCGIYCSKKDDTSYVSLVWIK